MICFNAQYSGLNKAVIKLLNSTLIIINAINIKTPETNQAATAPSSTH